MYRTKRGSESAAVKPDPAIRTGGGVRTDDMNFGKINGQSESSVVSPSSDSGVHSLGEQWEYMSTCSGNSDSIQTIKDVYGGVTSQADSPQDTRGVVFSHEETYGERDSMSYLSTNVIILTLRLCRISRMRRMSTRGGRATRGRATEYTDGLGW